MTKPNNSVSRRRIKISQVFFLFIKNSVDKKQRFLLTYLMDYLKMWFPAQNTQMRKPGKIALCEDTSPHTWVLLNNFCAITYVSHPNHLVHFTYTHKKLKLILIKQNLIHFGEKVFLTNFFSYFMFYDFAHCIDPHLFTSSQKLKKVQNYLASSGCLNYF